MKPGGNLPAVLFVNEGRVVGRQKSADVAVREEGEKPALIRTGSAMASR